MQVNGGPQLYHLPRKFSEILFDVKISKIDTLLIRPYKSRDIIVPKLAVQQPPNWPVHHEDQELQKLFVKI